MIAIAHAFGPISLIFENQSTETDKKLLDDGSSAFKRYINDIEISEVERVIRELEEEMPKFAYGDVVVERRPQVTDIKVSESNNIITEFKRLKQLNSSNVTYKDLEFIRQLYLLITYGKPVPITAKKVGKSGIYVPVYITEMMEQNNVRKDAMAEKIRNGD